MFRYWHAASAWESQPRSAAMHAACRASVKADFPGTVGLADGAAVGGRGGVGVAVGATDGVKVSGGAVALAPSAPSLRRQHL